MIALKISSSWSHICVSTTRSQGVLNLWSKEENMRNPRFWYCWKMLIVCCVISHLQGRCQCAAVRWSAEDRRWEVGHDLRERTTYPETVKPKQRSNSNNTLPCHHTWHKLTDLTRDRQMCTDVSKVCVPASYSLLPSYPTMRALPGPAFQIYIIFQLNTTAVIPRSIVATDL